MEDFLKESGPKVRSKFAKFLNVLSFEGPNMKRPYADMLSHGIRELRIAFGSNQYRGLYFFFHKDFIIVTHGFLKKTDEVPFGEIERALRYQKDFEARFEGGGIDYEEDQIRGEEKSRRKRRGI